MSSLLSSTGTSTPAENDQSNINESLFLSDMPASLRHDGKPEQPNNGAIKSRNDEIQVRMPVNPVQGISGYKTLPSAHSDSATSSDEVAQRAPLRLLNGLHQHPNTSENHDSSYPEWL